MTHFRKNQVTYSLYNCCICGSTNCQQAIDHQKLQFNQLNELMMDFKKNTPMIDQLKTQIKNKFLKLRRNINIMIKDKQSIALKWLDEFYFKHLQNKLQNNISIFCDILQNDFSKFPNRNISKTIKILKKSKNNKNGHNLNTQSIKKDIDDFLIKIDITKITQSISKQIKISSIIKNKLNPQLSNSNRSVKSQATTSNTSQNKIQLSPGLQTYQWKYVRFTKNTKTVDLSNRNINDQDMIKQLPIISTFNNIKEFQIRNNKITALTCNIIANDMRFLNVLDLRGNKVGDAGVSKIVIVMNNLKSLFVSETGITDKTGQLIAVNLPDLQTLWSEHTKMGGQVCIKICSKPKLRLLSLLGNPIQQQHKATITSIFRSKGYLNL